MSKFKVDREIAQKAKRGKVAAFQSRAFRCCMFTLHARCQTLAGKAGPVVELPWPCSTMRCHLPPTVSASMF